MPKADIARSYALPIKELSGLAVRADATGVELLAIGDKNDTLVRARWHHHELREVSSTQLDIAGNGQWEGIAADASGRVFLLRETPPSIVVMSAGLDAVVAELKLDADARVEGWTSEENSRGEGLIVLSNGHFLIAKEKKPPLLVEFGPAGEPATGVTEALLAGAPTLASSGTLVPLAIWAIDESLATDISDLFVGEGILFALSDDSRVILEFELPRPGEELVHRERSKLPEEVDSPEGLVVLEGRPVVGIDQKKLGVDNLFVFESRNG